MPARALTRFERDHAGVHRAPFAAERIIEIKLVLYGNKVCCRWRVGLDSPDLWR